RSSNDRLHVASVRFRQLSDRLCSIYYAYAFHRDPHSFPTRRSSDLSTGSRAGRSPVVAPAFRRDTRSASSSAACTSSWRCCCSRSEEHTSELQSPCNLVCRLLLEKKSN